MYRRSVKAALAVWILPDQRPPTNAQEPQELIGEQRHVTTPTRSAREAGRPPCGACGRARPATQRCYIGCAAVDDATQVGISKAAQRSGFSLSLEATSLLTGPRVVVVSSMRAMLTLLSLLIRKPWGLVWAALPSWS